MRQIVRRARMKVPYIQYLKERFCLVACVLFMTPRNIGIRVYVYVYVYVYVFVCVVSCGVGAHVRWAGRGMLLVSGRVLE